MNTPEGTSDFLPFDLPKNKSNVIKVIGVGGGGSNAINHMFEQGIKGVDFVICNTDAQALDNSPIPNKIQLGVSLTEGLGAGANPEVGEQAALESYDDIKSMLGSNTKMVFVTAGMGGGTGTGAAPIIAKMAKELDILTVGIVTVPFQFEGRMRNEQAQIGVEKLRDEVDSLIVINNNKLREVYGNLGFKAGFSKADEVLATASRGIAEVITHHYTQNIDLRDAKTVLSNSGTAIMGSASASGNERAHTAISKALDSPLLNDNKITGAKNVLLLIVSGIKEITLDEIGEINEYIQAEAGYGANVIMGVGEDESLDESISVTVIATGFNAEQQDSIVNTEAKKIIHTLGNEQSMQQNLSVNNTGRVVIPEEIKSNNDLIETEETKQHLEPELETETKIEEVIIHNLFDEEFEEQKEVSTNPKVSFEKTEDSIVLTNQEEDLHIIDLNSENQIKEQSLEKEVVNHDDFVIIDLTEKQESTLNVNESESNQIVEVKDAQEISFDETTEQFALTFDMPIQEKSEISTPEQETSFESKTIEEPEIIKHVLDDNIDEIKIVTKTKEKTSVVNTRLPEDEVVFEKKVLPALNEVEIQEEEVTEKSNPLDLPLSQLKENAHKRRATMKKFNHKFKSLSNTNQIDDIEKEPAYKRAGLELNDVDTSTQVSRTSVSLDSNNELQIRKNNSFLHDNVD